MGLFSSIFKQLQIVIDKKKTCSSMSDGSSSSSDSRINNKKGVNWIFSNKPKSDNVAAIIHQSSSGTTNESKQSNFKYNELGRRYHGIDEVSYFLPNDDDETDRLHQQHWILRYILQRNFHSPVGEMLKKGITVLDSGTGPGTWVLELAEAYPQTQFVGLDVSPVFPQEIKPPNVDFILGNIAKEIPFPENTFDYIHQRLLFAALTSKDWENSLRELYRVLKPGGYIELAEFCLFDLLSIGPHMTKLQSANIAVFGALGMPIKICEELEERSIKAGFVNQVLEITPLPINHEGKKGELLWNDAKHGYTNIRPAMIQIHPEWNDAEVYEAFLSACGEEARRMKSVVNWYSLYAQKPLLQ